MSENNESACPNSLNEGEDYGKFFLIDDGNDDYYDFKEYVPLSDDEAGPSYVVRNDSPLPDDNSAHLKDSGISTSSIGKAIKNSLELMNDRPEGIHDEATDARNFDVASTDRKRTVDVCDELQASGRSPKSKRVCTREETADSENVIRLQLDTETFEIKVPEEISKKQSTRTREAVLKLARLEDEANRVAQCVSDDYRVVDELKKKMQMTKHIPDLPAGDLTNNSLSPKVFDLPAVENAMRRMLSPKVVPKVESASHRIPLSRNVSHLSTVENIAKRMPLSSNVSSPPPIRTVAKRIPFSPSVFNIPQNITKTKPMVRDTFELPRDRQEARTNETAEDVFDLSRVKLEPIGKPTPRNSVGVSAVVQKASTNLKHDFSAPLVKVEPTRKKNAIETWDEDEDGNSESEEDSFDAGKSKSWFEDEAEDSDIDNDDERDLDYDASQDSRVPMFKDNSLEMDPSYLMPTTSKSHKKLGKQAQETLHRERTLTIERLKDLYGSLVARPTEKEKAEDPEGLKIRLMGHQKHALAWLHWRESQKPPGGVLADDMGLGKTLTLISLVLSSKAKTTSKDEEEKNVWKSSARGQRHLGGTLIIVPASLIGQWASEIKNRVKKGYLSVYLYYGEHREKCVQRLANFDIVITSYGLVSNQNKRELTGIMYKIRWRRIILDEAHMIRNHQSQSCTAVCALYGNMRWALTGTPIQNRAIDLYAILKFLQCSPFDDMHMWKRWVDNKNAAGCGRLSTVMEALMLRRTKKELMENGSIAVLPDKTVELIRVELDNDERLVYEKVMVYSRTLFAQYLEQQAEKKGRNALGTTIYDPNSWTNNYRAPGFTKAQNKLLSKHADIKLYWILVLLLRLRQICCHPSLIKAMLDRDDYEQGGIQPAEVSTDDEALLQINDLLNSGEKSSIKDEDDEIGVDERVNGRLLVSENPVFGPDRKSSKIRAVVSKVTEITASGEDKIIVVSQWVGFLNIVANELSALGTTYGMFTGQISMKDRQELVANFNAQPDPKILLLSLTAGGVGLNLVGANHLLLIDIHWNPQLENQAQDRIYRFGQRKDVHVYKYICTDSIEERVKALQDKKLEIASAVLTGGRTGNGSTLSLDDIKTLFGL